MVISFCGHSSYISNEQDKKQILELIESVGQNKHIDFYLGGYGNFDSFARVCAKEYQAKHPDSKLYFITPYLEENYGKLDYVQDLYDGSIYPEIENIPKRYAISKRNEWMVTHSDYIIAYVSHTFGGAYKTLLYAKKKNKTYTNIFNGEKRI